MRRQGGGEEGPNALGCVTVLAVSHFNALILFDRYVVAVFNLASGDCPQTRKLSNMNILNRHRSEDLGPSILIAFKHVEKQPSAALTAAK